MNTESPFPLDENRWLKIKPKVLASFLVVTSIAVGSWLTIKFDVNLIRRDVTDHTRSLEIISAQLQSIESEARTAREAAMRGQYQQDLINQKLDFLTGDKRGPRPATGSVP